MSQTITPRNTAIPPLRPLTQTPGLTLQRQIRERLIDAILSGVFPVEKRLPSSRKLAKQLGVARNTAVLAYHQLVSEGYLVARERSGLYINRDIVKGRLQFEKVGGPSAAPPALEWKGRIRNPVEETSEHRIPPDWQKFPFPFIEGRFDPALFPINEWREASRLALGMREVQHWAVDTGGADDPLLIEEIRTKVLPRRGIHARSEEILITAGSQQALHLLAEIFAGHQTRVAVEEPGNPAFHALLKRRGARIVAQPLDDEGMILDGALGRCDLAYVTPSHQRPTTITMSMARRHALLAKASESDFVVIEDDFECETNYLDDAFPALRSLEGGDRVIYVASLSRVLAPGLRLGFIVASPEVVNEARRLRALVTRHPPLTNQRTAALFISLGHYDTTMLRIGRIFRERLLALRDALNHYRPAPMAIAPVRGGTTYWVHGPDDLDARNLAQAAEAHGVLIEPVGHCYVGADAPKNVFRMGVTGIPSERIRAGVAALDETIREMRGENTLRIDAQSRPWLRGDELHRTMSGLTLLYRTVYGDPCTIELQRDGTMVGRAGYANEDRDGGRWWIEEDRWYRQWKGWAYGEVSSFHIRIDGDRVLWLDARGVIRDSAIIARSGVEEMS